MKKQDHVWNIEYLVYAIDQRANRACKFCSHETWSSFRPCDTQALCQHPAQSRSSSLQVSRNEEEGRSIVQLGQVSPSKNPAVAGDFPFRNKVS